MGGDTVNKAARKLARKMEFQGLEISIETDKGQKRHWYDPHNKTEGTTTMMWPYGYLRGMKEKGADGDLLDCYVGPNEEADKVYIVHQLKAPDFKDFDEDKVMLGFSSAARAKAAYLEHYNSPKFFGSMDEMTVDEFKDSFVKKSLNDMNMAPKFSFDVDDPRNVEHWFNNIGTLKDKDLLGLSAEIWGPGYRYQQTSKDHSRAELRGFLHDQLELLATQGLVPQGEGSLPPANQLPHAETMSDKSDI